jgi:hypothetical protein
VSIVLALASPLYVLIVARVTRISPEHYLDSTTPKRGAQGNTLAAPSGLTVTAPAIKGDLPTGEYYLADCPEYDRVDPATMLLFATEEEAQQMGFHKAENYP